MKRIFTFFVAVMMASMASGNPVTLESARKIADSYYYGHNSISKSGESNVADVFSKSFNGITTFYVFNYQSGGFVVVSADDAVTPILAESDSGYFDIGMSNPSVRYWFNGYNRQIADIVTAKYDNTQTLQEWNKIQAEGTKRAAADVGPLLKTSWDQGCYYNAQCPADAKARTVSCGHVWTGCVATTMSQLAKYYSFPAHGYLTHSYIHPDYGLQSANFVSTAYNWTAMPNIINSANSSVAAFMYQAGVSVNMQYGTVGSGAFSEDVPWALVNYFNYDPSIIAYKEKKSFTDNEWSDMLKAELDASRPVYYSGRDDSTGHAWVCDGYRNSDGKFHMNWGWSGSANGYYVIGALNPNDYMPNLGNAVIIGIRPGNPNLVARITNIRNNTTLYIDATVPIDVSIVEGTATSVKLFVDDTEIYSTSLSSFTYNWSTSGTAPGTHILKVVATNASETSYFPVAISINGWIKQASGFTTASRGIHYIDAVDSLVLWAIAIDGSGAGSTINEFTKTVNGGDTWTPGKVLGGSTYGLGNICGLNGNIAYVTLYKGAATQDNTCGVYKTINGGATWTHLIGALQATTSFADNVWFWNEKEGMCHGDVSGTGASACFEIYTTSNGGSAWTRVPKSNIGGGADPAAGEGGWTSVIQAVGDSTIIFGSNKGKLYISHDRGHKWIISNTGITPAANGGINLIAFKDKLNGLAAQTDETVILKETHDGGATWQTISANGFLTTDLTYVEGTDNTYICTGAASGASGAAYSFDGGHTWQAFKGTELTQYLATDWVNNHTGWAGGYNLSSAEGGMYKFTGILQPAAAAIPENVKIAVSGGSVLVSWEIPVTVASVIGYNVFRDGVLLTPSPATALFYKDEALANGFYNYCVAAVYNNSISDKVCISVTTAITETENPNLQLNVYPNPVMGLLRIDSDKPFTMVDILNFAGQVVYSNAFSGNHMQIITSSFKAGMYLVRVHTRDGFIIRKISVK